MISVAIAVRLAPLALAATLAGCTSSAAHEQAAAPRPVPEAPKSYDLVGLTRMSSALDERLHRHVEACLVERGYPQMQEARRLAVVRPTSGARETLVFDPLEAGPYTREQAERYGVLGTADLFDDGEPGHVISKNADFDEAQADCRSAFAADRGEEVQAALSAFAQLQNTLRRALLERAQSDIGALLAQRLDCVRQGGYENLPTDTEQPVRDLLVSAGVVPGRHASPPPVEPEVEEGTVRVFAPAQHPEYLPSEAEKAFALVYVRCGQEQGFLSAWERAQAEHRRALLAEKASELDHLGVTLETLLEVSSPAPGSRDADSK